MAAPAKIKLCLDSIKTVSTWKETHGDDIEWFEGGYVFVAYRAPEEKVLKDLHVIQKKAGLNIEWYGRDEMLKLVPGLNPGQDIFRLFGQFFGGGASG